MFKVLSTLFVSFMAVLALGIASFASAQSGDSPEVIEVALGGSTIVNLGGNFGQVTLTDPEIADVTSAGGGLLVIGRRVGETNLILYGGGDRSEWLVKVTLPAQAIQSELASMFPRQDITAKAVGGALVLSGEVDSAPAVVEAEQVALGYLRSPSISALGVEPNVINLLKVKDKQQVQLEVRFAEVGRNSIRSIGVNGNFGSPDGRVAGALGNQAVLDANPRTVAWTPLSTVPGAPMQAMNPASSASSGAIFVGTQGGKFPFAATLDLLARRDLAKTLAEPTLVAMSGQEANFLSGGEFPFEKSAGLGATSVEFKQFGIQLSFSPTVMADQTIQLQTSVSVSAPDSTTSITTNGTMTQGFKRRGADTTVRLRDGQSFVIAGLLSDEIENQIAKVPGLGDIPILGMLFSSKSFTRKETELIVVVTARLVDPLDTDEMPRLPGESRISDPTDLELFLLNITEPNAEVQDSRRQRQQNRRAELPLDRKPVGRVGFWR